MHPFDDTSIDSLRQDTPGCSERTHLNNAGAGLMPRCVLEAMHEYLELEARIGGYEAEAERGEAIEACYGDVGRLLGTQARNIAMVENATVAFAQALSCLSFERGDVILTSRNDYISNQLMFLSLSRRIGVEVVHAPDSDQGGFDVEAMLELIERRRPKLVSITHVPTNSGLVQPIESIGSACRESGAWFLVDACQSVGQLPVNAQQLGCDFLSATSRKFLRGPRGAGFLYVSDRALEAGLEPLFLDMRGCPLDGARCLRARRHGAALRELGVRLRPRSRYGSGGSAGPRTGARLDRTAQLELGRKGTDRPAGGSAGHPPRPRFGSVRDRHRSPAGLGGRGPLLGTDPPRLQHHPDPARVRRSRLRGQGRRLGHPHVAPLLQHGGRGGRVRRGHG